MKNKRKCCHSKRKKCVTRKLYKKIKRIAKSVELPKKHHRGKWKWFLLIVVFATVGVFLGWKWLAVLKFGHWLADKKWVVDAVDVFVWVVKSVAKLVNSLKK